MTPKIIFLIAILTTALSNPFYALAEEEVEDIGVVKYGVSHNIAADRKVVKVGGIYEPEGVDIYLKRHIDDLNETISNLSGRIESLESKVKRTNDALEELAKSNEK